MSTASASPARCAVIVGPYTSGKTTLLESMLFQSGAIHRKGSVVAGNTVGDLFAAHTSSFEAAGYGHAALNACGYTLGIAYPPTWMDWPMIWAGNPDVLEPGMVFFMHMILLDDRTGLTMSLAETALVTDGACEPVTHAPRELVVN